MLQFGLSSPLAPQIPGLHGTDFAAITAWSGLLAAAVLASVNHYLDANEIPMSADVPGRGRIPRERPESNGLVGPCGSTPAADGSQLGAHDRQNEP
jgi:hypothetical protein